MARRDIAPGWRDLTEGSGRDRFLEEHPATRVYHASLRLPRMHHIGWTGKKTSSQTPYGGAIWDRRANHVALPRRFNWREICALPEWQGWL